MKDKFKSFENLPVVVISTFGHCAVDWLGNLLDSHPQVIHAPPLSYFRKLKNYQNLENIFIEKLELRKLVNFTMNNILEKSNYKSYNYFENNKKKNYFKNCLINYLKQSEEKNIYRKLFFAINYSFAKMNRINIKKIKIILAHEHTAWNCSFYKDLFNSKFIFMIRDPRATFAGSFRAFDRYINFPKSYKMDIVLSFWVAAEKFVNKNNKKIVYVVKNENINKNIKLEVTKLSKWLKIKYDKTLLCPTYLGRKWHGDSSYLGKFERKKPLPKNYYSQENVKKRWEDYLDKKTILVIETVFEKLMNKFGYKLQNNLNYQKRFFAYFYLLFGYEDKKNILTRSYYLFKNCIRRILIINFNLYHK